MILDPYQEKLDDPNLPFEIRWPLIEEIDNTNHRFRIYKTFLKKWNSWFLNQNTDLKSFSVLEVGSGSGGLSLQLEKWAQTHGIELELNLYDSQADVLEKSLEKFSQKKPQTHIATEKHLKIYADQQFDFVISLHVIHHIQPLEEAVDALSEMMRISKRGIFVVDLENKPFAVPIAKVWNSMTGVSPELSDDGIKSLLRAHPPKKILEKLEENSSKSNHRLELERDFLLPYWTLKSQRM